MRRALELAAPHRTHPNPRVGAVVLDPAGEIVAEAAHHGPGLPHAERLALDSAGDRARGGTLVVTLEPCDHHGRTPPCADSILGSGVARVVVGATDPDRRVSGRGIERLRDAGVDVITGVLEEEAEAVDPAYFHHRRSGRPRVTLKAAATLDGQTAAADGSSQWITSTEARADAHRLRAEVDAVMVGAGTILADDPLLTARHEGWSGHQPRPVLVAGSRPLRVDARVWSRDPVVLAPGPIEAPAAAVIEVPGSPGRVDLAAGLVGLGELGLLDVLVEGGAGLAAALLQAGLVDRGVLYLAGAIAGGVGRGLFDAAFATLSDLRRVELIDVRRVGPDLRVEWVT